MKYQYGVEYRNRGFKPDLPDDVLLEVLTKKAAAGQVGKVSAWNWSPTISNPVDRFRIIDDRYKPKPVRQLPDVGTVCKAYHAANDCWYDVEVLKYNNAGAAAVMRLDTSQLFRSVEFRPVRTDRDKFIDAAMSVGELRGRDGAKEVYGRLFDAGFKAPE